MNFIIKIVFSTEYYLCSYMAPSSVTGLKSVFGGSSSSSSFPSFSDLPSDSCGFAT